MFVFSKGLNVIAGLVALFGVVSLAPVSAVLAAEGQSLKPHIKVFKSPTCGCCGKWAAHLRDNGFTVKEINARSMAEIKRIAGIGPKLKSCHTAFLDVDGEKDSDAKEGKVYVIEGHVPAADIKRLLEEKPAIKGLTVPGMPLGSPGMEQPDGTKEPYEVLSFDEDGKTGVWSRY